MCGCHSDFLLFLRTNKIQSNVFNTVLPDPCNGDFGISLGAANYYNELKPFKGIFMGFNQSLDTSIFKNKRLLFHHVMM